MNEVAPKKRGRPKSESTDYFATLTMGDTMLDSHGSSVLSCLDKLVRPFPVKTRATLRIKYDEKIGMMNLYPFQIRRFMVNKIYRQLLAKRLNIIMK